MIHRSKRGVIHQFKRRGLNIVIDVFSGAVHVVDEIVYDILERIGEKTAQSSVSDISEALGGQYNSGDIAAAFDEVNELIANGLLYSSDTDELLASKGMADRMKRGPVVKALCLHISHACNLDCVYCFAGGGRYNENKSAFMSTEVGIKALDFLVEHSGSRRNLEIDFFGGEPTLNFDTVKRIIEHGRNLEKKHNKRFRFTLTTNGLLVDDEMIEYINKNISNVVLSIDGRKAVNDKMRRMNGGGSYDRIVPIFKKIAGSRENYYVRGTFTRNNLDFSEDVLHLAELGFDQISVEPVVAPSDTDYALKKEDLAFICEQYDRLADEIIERNEKGKGFNFFHFMIDLEGGPCAVKRVAGCGAGGEYLAVTPDGDLYPCHQFVGKDEFLIGSVFDGIKNSKLRELFSSCNVLTKPECKTCWCRNYCSGGCAANSFNETGKINGLYEIGCELTKKRTECAIYIKAAEAFGS